ncbi:hypothetical protein CkaCkLH20_08574 [Colletotrichum karsti]|uniref:Short-chain dehydrogenase n=1 Tax=Colletotrichum karsti TaxID=1095194 RepID=A0A9P6LIL1_9PEZI|nr:uncharacterized protein CkaCkLH20_08574 [Colletotrichum karsti]KAF9873840.1 hypothetical protein CkaCkLH20_08574 [Colletotrichum karsti]
MSRYITAHQSPEGPGDSRPRAIQIIEDEDLRLKLQGKSVFITGANQGIGLETARALHATGATVYLGVRDLAKGQEAINDILASETSTGAPLHLIKISLDSLQSVRDAANTLQSQTDKLNILILNAGVMATPEGRTVDGFETQFGINHLSHFLLFRLLDPLLLAAVTPTFHSRVICVSSMAHRAGGIRFHDINFEEKGSYHPWVAYGQSKTANIYMANEIEKRYGGKGLHALSLHPGGIQTNLSQHLDQDTIAALGANPELQKQMKSVAQGAATSVYAAVSKEWEGRGGRYLSNCIEQGPAAETSGSMSTDEGHAQWAYDESAAAKLWAISCEMVGLVEE